jgi:hypothetical protein
MKTMVDIMYNPQTCDDCYQEIHYIGSSKCLFCLNIQFQGIMRKDMRHSNKVLNDLVNDYKIRLIKERFCEDMLGVIREFMHVNLF